MTHTNMKRDRPLLGIGLAVLATFLFACLNSMTKHISLVYPVVTILWFRYLFFCSYGLISGLKKEGPRAFCSIVPILQVLRAILLLSEIGVYVFAFRYLPLAEISAISAIGPIMTMGVSALILRESIINRQWCAAVFGFLGVMIIVKPGFSSFNPLMITPICGTALWCLYQILTRFVSKYEGSEKTTLFTSTIGFGILCFLLPFFWDPVDVSWLGELVLLAIFGAAGHATLIKALSIAPASLLQPFSYLGIVWAILFGWLFFNETPQFATVLGALIIVVSGFYILKCQNPDI
ncbi:MAG: EamA family transporter [Rhodospirillaceae bacterium]|nr:EamA family transporter [Rhodospirillaceae bacterium]